MNDTSTTWPAETNGSLHVHRNTYRLFCFLAGVLCPAFGVIYHLTEPAALDPLWARFGMALVAMMLLSLSYMNEWIEQHFIRLVHGLFYLMTAYFIGLTYLNGFSPNYAIGALFAMTVIGIAFSLGLQQLRPLVSYLLTASLMAIGAVLLADQPEVNAAIMGISAVSTGIVIYAVARAKVEAEELALSSEKRYRYVHTLINAANDAIFIADPASGRIIEANRKAQTLIGQPTNEIRRMQLRDLYPEDERERYAALLEEHVYEQEPVVENLFIVNREGTRIPVDLNASLIDVGSRQLIQAIIRDATERQRYERQLIAAKERAEELLRLKTSFLNNMSHELRTPLTSILGYAEVLHDEASALERDFAGRIVDSAKRLQATLNSVLDLAQLESGEASLQLEHINVAEEVEAVVALLQPVAKKKGLALNTVIEDDEVYAALDAACVNRIINNLVGNAIKFTEEGHVIVTVGSAADQVFVRVEDSGIGIDEQFTERLFEEFTQESMGMQRTHEGNGLGLAITKRLVDLMNGHIEVESEKGVGSTFTVYFPLTADMKAAASSGTSKDDEPVAPEQAAPEQAAPPPPYEALSHIGKVLVLEDNPLTRELIRHHLEDHCQVHTLADPHDALELARQQTFDLLLVDIHLSAEQNGIEVLHALRALPAYQHTPAIALTAYALPTDRERFLGEGFDLYLSKPFTAEQLFQTIYQAQSQPTAVSDPGTAP